MEFLTSPKLPLDDLYTHTFYVKHEPVEKIDPDIKRKYWTFEINNIDIGTYLRPNYTDIELTLSAVDEKDDVLQTNTTGNPDAQPPVLPIQDTTASMANSSLYSYFSNVKCFINYELVSDSYQLYHIQSYFYNLFSVSAQASESVSKCWGFFNDGNHSGFNARDTIINKGLKARNKMLENGKKFCLRGPLLLNIFNQSTPICKSNIRLEFERNIFEKMSFRKEGGMAFKVHDIAIYGCYSKMRESYTAKLAPNLLKTPQIYACHDTEINYYKIDNGASNFKNRLFLKSAPNLILVAFSPTAVFNGSFSTNLLSFKYPNLSQIFIKNEAFTYPLGRAYRFDPTTPSFVEAYKSLHDNLKINSMLFSLDDYPKNYFILAFDMTASFSYGDDVIRPVTSYDNINIYLDFHTALTADHNLIVAAYYNKNIKIDALTNSCIVSY